MTELTPRQKLIKEINEQINGALQEDFENGVRSLNEAAAAEFYKKYPALNEVLDWIRFLSYEELPLD